jgi:hypothetical protein
MVAFYPSMVIWTRPNHSAVHSRSAPPCHRPASRRLKTSSSASSLVDARLPTSEEVEQVCGGVPSGPSQSELDASRRTRLPAASDHPCPLLQALPVRSKAHVIQPQLHPGGARLSTASPSKGVYSGYTVWCLTSRPRAAPAGPALRFATARAACGVTAQNGLQRPSELQLPGPTSKTRRTTRWAEDTTRMRRWAEQLDELLPLTRRAASIAGPKSSVT